MNKIYCDVTNFFKIFSYLRFDESFLVYLNEKVVSIFKKIVTLQYTNLKKIGLI